MKTIFAILHENISNNSLQKTYALVHFIRDLYLAARMWPESPKRILEVDLNKAMHDISCLLLTLKLESHFFRAFFVVYLV